MQLIVDCLGYPLGQSPQPVAQVDADLTVPRFPPSSMR